ncbi:MAG: DegV family protein [Eggerthellaceae bacterium]|jgi:DegV family protein with EDD domain|nr:DegV family protein [Eggerthellaceae bacterium]MCH4220693.1 DegV family protein [Eggerthellaceae bacterium]
MKPACNLIIDSCSDLPKDAYDREGVSVAHLSYTDDQGASHVDDMYETLSAHDFYGSMRDGAMPKTSQVSLKEFDDLFRPVVDSGIPTVYLAFSSGLSGTYDAAILALDAIKQECGHDVPLYIVDTLLGSTPEGLIVSEALRQRDRGLSALELVHWVEEARFYVHTMFMVDDLEALRRGGRIPSSVAFAGAKLDVKPLLSFDVDGKLSLVGVARGRKKGMKRMAEFYESMHDSNKISCYAAVGNADCPKDADRLSSYLRDIDGNVLVMRSSIGPVIGCHVGPNMISISFWGNDRRKSLSVADRIANKVKKS